MRVLHVTRSINRSEGGPARSVQGLVAALNGAGVEAWLLALNMGPRPWVDGIEHFSDSEPFEDVVLRFKPQIVHLHGLWDIPTHRCAVICRRWGIPYVISPRGMLDPWPLSVKKWKKRFGMLLYQKRDLKCASAFHATAETEAQHIRAQGLKQPIIVSPNGVDLPAVMPERAPMDEYRGKTAVFLSRLHPGKGLLTLADAWAQVRPEGWRMLVVGPDTYGHKKDVVASLVQYGLIDEWKFMDAVDDKEKWRIYRSTDLLVHPSVSENFGMTIAEGLAAELPVIATKGAPWSELETRKCGWWIDSGVEPLANALKDAMSLSDAERFEMGARGRALIDEKYSWSAAARAMVEGYGRIVHARN